MNNPLQSIIASIHYYLTQHPELAWQVEMMAVQAQGRSPEDFHSFQEWRKYRNLSTAEVFTKIYSEGEWGRSDDPNRPFFSGSGSDTAEIVNVYVAAVRRFLSQWPHKLSALDLGCGDFHVGSQLRPYCSSYIACDIVSPLIDFNKRKFADLDVDFRVLDLIEDDLPSADVVFVRQVLQHLSNAHIAQFVRKIPSACRHLVVTEHLPAGRFQPNIDKPPGGGIRFGYPSGVVLTEAPFNLRPRSGVMLCEAPENGGLIRTMLYSFE